MDLNWKQQDAEMRCINLVLSTLMFHKTIFDFNIDTSKIYFIPNAPHMHRSQWKQEDIIIIYESEEENQDSIQIYGKSILHRLGDICCIGTSRKDYDIVIEELLGGFMHGMSAEQIKPFKKYIDIFSIDPNLISRAIKLKVFW